MAAEFEIQKALYSALSALDLRVYDSAPQQADGASLAVFPYVEVGFINLRPFDDSTNTGFNFVARIHTRSRSAAMGEAKQIQGQIYDRLHRGALSITGFHTVLIEREMSDCSRASDNSFHGVCEYRGLIEAA
jgi:hypothetical protein